MFRTRLISGIILLIIALGAMSIGGLPLLLVLLFSALVAYRELTKALRCATDDRRLNALEWTGSLGVVAYYAALYFSDETVLLLMCIVAVFMAEMLLYVVTFPKFKADQVVAAVFSFLYAPVMLSFVYLTRMGPRGIYLVWLILISSWGCDTCAYAVGILIGKKKIFPHLSPKKSLEGCIGGVAGAALIGGLYAYFFAWPAYEVSLDASMLPLQGSELVGQGYGCAGLVAVIAFICALGAVMSMVGDLAASAIKRNHDIKDYGRLIPGHGGIMDRFDSMTVTAPMVYFLALLLIS